MKRQDAAPFILFALFWALYQSTIAHTYSYDGVSFALDVEFGNVSQLFHPNHLLYAFLYRQLYGLFQFLGYQGRAIYLMESLNALVGAAAVAIFGWSVSRRFGTLRGFLAAGLFGVSQAFWSEAIDPGCYALAGLGAVLLLELLLETRDEYAFLTGLLHGGIILLHQMFFLVAPAFLAAYFLKTEKGFRNSSRYSLGVLSGAILPYVLAAHIFHSGSWAQELSWILTPAGTPPSGKILSGYWWTWGLLPDLRAWWEELAQSLVARGAWNEAFLASLLLLVIIWSVRQYRQRSALWPGMAGVWAWVLALNLFQFFFFHALRYSILFMPPFLYIVAAATSRSRGKNGLFVPLAVLLLIGITNYSDAIAPRKSWGVDRARIRWIERRLRPVDFLLFEGRGTTSIQNVYMAYFAPEIPARSLYGYLLDQYGQPVSHMEGLTARMAEVWQRGGSVWVEKGLLDSNHETEVEAQEKLGHGAVRNWFRRFTGGRELVGPDGYRLVELKPAFHAK